MSRIGKQPIELPKGVDVTLEHWALSRDHMEMFVRPDPLPIDLASTA